MKFQNEIIQGDCLDLMPLIPDASVHCVVTSPPYWGLRDYGVDGQIGLEETFDEWLGKMVDVFREVRRVLRPDGTFFLNIGDSYANTGCKDTSKVGGFTGERIRANKKGIMDSRPRQIPFGLKPKDLIGQPWALAFALRDDGWYLRSDIIWAKPNPMPESVTDRPTKSHEHIFLLTKSGRYFYDADAVREKLETPLHSPGNKERKAGKACQTFDGKSESQNPDRLWGSPAGRNLRDVWTIPTQPFPEAHFATFPEKLPKLCIMAGTSERGCCPDCGAPWERVIEVAGGCKGKDWANKKERETRLINRGSESEAMKDGSYHRNHTGWRATCECGIPETIPSIVLDPFAGAGTTCVVAGKLGRNYIGIELSEDYCEIARKRIERETKQQRMRL